MPVVARRLLAASAACAALLVLVYLLSRRSGAAWWDERILEIVGGRVRGYRLIEGAEGLRGFFGLLPYALLVVLLLASVLYRRLLGPAALAAAVLLAANLSTWVLQHRTSEPRIIAVLDEPPWLSYWPSGHATAAAALAFAAVLVGAPRWRAFIIVAAIVATVPAVLTNLVLRVHVPSDVVGGVLVAAVWGLLALAAQQVWPVLRSR